MLTLVAVEHQPRRIPLANWFRDRTSIRRNHLIQRRRSMRRIGDVFTVYILLPMELPSERRVISRILQRELLGHVVLEPRIRFRRESELPGEFKVLIGADRHKVTAARRLTIGNLWNIAARDLHDRTVFDSPMGGWH